MQQVSQGRIQDFMKGDQLTATISLFVASDAAAIQRHSAICSSIVSFPDPPVLSRGAREGSGKENSSRNSIPYT